MESVPHKIDKPIEGTLDNDFFDLGCRYLCSQENVAIFALADCNNLFASCERVFRPDSTYKESLSLFF